MATPWERSICLMGDPGPQGATRLAHVAEFALRPSIAIAGPNNQWQQRGCWVGLWA